MMQSQLHFVVMAGAAILVTCNAQIHSAELFGNDSYPISNGSSAPGSNNATKNTSVPTPRQETSTLTEEQTTTTKYITNTFQNTTHSININQNEQSTCSTEKYKTGIMISIIIIAVLVLVCAILIICSVILANKVASLKNKLATSKRQARSNGDFLSASSILWPSGMDTWQKKAQLVSHTMDEISLEDRNEAEEEKNQLMLSPIDDKSKHSAEDGTATLEKDCSSQAKIIVEI
ncbi:protein EVI2A [Spea bombifrons]|uniref:protein EVI2A n=1 Tax=Spea bombifrons TaxID=233779 RepID=UPI00234BC1F4|nr:protein EVI2A [Spea bombifrons]